MTGHKFGGAWTEVKLDAISAYLVYYNKVLLTKPRLEKPFRRWYIDAFAGSGSRTAQISRGGLLEGEPLSVEEIELAGSARKALEIDPPFDRLLFVEPHRRRFQGLAELKTEYPGRNIDCRQGDANQELSRIFTAAPWRNRTGQNWTDRAVVFLDPYGMGVDWSTLEILAQTRAADVWYLFPLEAVNRQLAHNLDRVDENKQVRLDQIFGTPDWRVELYQTHVEQDLFDLPMARTGRNGSKKQIQQYAIDRLGTVFSYVSEPLPLVNDADRHLFSLLCLANPATPAARDLIDNGVKWVFKRYGAASRHRSAP